VEKNKDDNKSNGQSPQAPASSLVPDIKEHLVRNHKTAMIEKENNILNEPATEWGHAFNQ
jgi:hypothetical protein